MIRTYRKTMPLRAALGLSCVALAVLPAGASGAKIPADPAAAEKEAAALVLATVDGEPITLADLQEGFGARHMGHGSLLAGRSILEGVLDKAIEERLLIQEGERMGIPQEPGIEAAVQAYRDVQLLEAMERKEFHDAAEPTEAQIERTYEKLKVQRRLFLIETPERDRAEEALRRLEAGEPFGEVAREISTDRSRTRDGDLGWVTWGRLAPAVEEAVAPAAEGETVGPVEADGVYSVVRIAEIKEGNPPEMGRVADRLREILRQRRRTEIFRDFVAAIRRDHPPEENQEALEALSREQQPGGGDGQVLPGATVLMRTESGLELTAGKVRERSEQSGLPLAEAWKKAAVDTLLIDEARRRVRPDEEMLRAVEAYRDSLVRRKVEMLALQAMPDIPEKEIRAYYEGEKEEFKAPGSYHLRHILVGTEAEAREIRRALAGGADFAQLARERSLDTESGPAGGDLGWVEAPAGAEASGRARGILGLEPGEISEVLAMPEGFAVVQMLEMKEGAMPSYEDVKVKVARSVVARKREEILERFLDRLRDHSEITRNEGALERGALLLDVIAERRLTPAAEGGKPGRHP